MIPGTQKILAGCFALAVGLMMLPSQALAVATLEVTVTDGTNVLPGETIALFAADGKQVEEKENKAGVWFFNDLEPGTYTVKSGGETIRTVTISASDTVKRISVNAGAYAATARASNWNWPNRARRGRGHTGSNWAWGVRGFGKSGSFDSRLDYSGNSYPGDVDIRAIGVGADFTYRPPNMMDFFLMPGFAWLPSADDKGSVADLHPTPNDDSFMQYDEEYYFRMLMGWTFFRGQQLELDALGGIQATRTKTSLHTDESGGAGNLEIFEKSEFQWSPVLGLQARHKLNNSNASIYGGITATHMPSSRVSGTSGLSFNYTGRVDSGWQGEAGIGIMFPF